MFVVDDRMKREKVVVTGKRKGSGDIMSKIIKYIDFLRVIWVREILGWEEIWSYFWWVEGELGRCGDKNKNNNEKYNLNN